MVSMNPRTPTCAQEYFLQRYCEFVWLRMDVIWIGGDVEVSVSVSAVWGLVSDGLTFSAEADGTELERGRMSLSSFDSMLSPRCENLV